jgi:hypothetical protein
MQQIVTRPRAIEESRGSGIALWALAGFALYVLGGAVSLFITALLVDPMLTSLGMPVEAGEIGLSVRNALDPVAWGVLVACVSVPIGRRLVPGIRFAPAGWVVLAIGVVLASLTWFLLEEFVRGRFEYVDVDYVGFTVFTWLALVAIALCGWAALAVPRGSGGPLAVLLALAVTGMGLALVPSVPGVADGIEPENLPLALVFLVDLVYAVAVIAIVFRRIASPRDA